MCIPICHDNEAVWTRKDVSFIKDLYRGGLSCREPSLRLREKAFSLSALSIFGIQNQSRCHRVLGSAIPFLPGTHGKCEPRTVLLDSSRSQRLLGAQKIENHRLGSPLLDCVLPSLSGIPVVKRHVDLQRTSEFKVRIPG